MALSVTWSPLPPSPPNQCECELRLHQVHLHTLFEFQLGNFIDLIYAVKRIPKYRTKSHEPLCIEIGFGWWFLHIRLMPITTIISIKYAIRRENGWFVKWKQIVRSFQWMKVKVKIDLVRINSRRWTELELEILFFFFHRNSIKVTQFWWKNLSCWHDVRIYNAPWPYA